jgi:hypothetical protein
MHDPLGARRDGRGFLDMSAKRSTVAHPRAAVSMNARV